MRHSEAYKEKKLALKKREDTLRKSIDVDSSQIEKLAGKIILLFTAALVGFIAFRILRNKTKKMLKPKSSRSRFWGLVTTFLPWAIDYFLLSKKFKR